MDLQWILDRLLELGKIASAQDVRIHTSENDIIGLKRLYDRVAKLEAGQEIEDKEHQVGPQRRQVLVQTISVAVAIASVAINIFIYFATHGR